MIECPRCHQRIYKVPTCYGARATCTSCQVRWTLIAYYDQDWQPERYHPTDERWEQDQ